MGDWRDKFYDFVCQGLIKEALDIKKGRIPNRLFKYRPCDSYSLENLKNDKVWLAHPSSFNDPYDCHNFFDHMKLLRERSPMLLDKLSKDMARTLSDLFNSRTVSFKGAFRVCSFSARSDSSLMWAHYADSHKGFCIEYDVTGAELDSERFMLPVLYKGQVHDSSRFFADDQEDELRASASVFGAALVKSKDWEYEQEWRLVFNIGHLEDRSSKGTAYPMPQAKAVYIGSHMPLEDVYRLRAICEPKGIKQFRMRHSNIEFAMKPTLLENNVPT